MRISHVACLTLIVSTLALVSPQQSAAPLEEPKASDLVRAYERYLEAFSKSTFGVEVKGYYNGPEMPPNTLFQEASYRIWYDGLRWKQTVSLVSRTMHKGKLETVREMVESTYPHTGSLTIGLDPKTRRPEGVLAQLKELSDEERREGIGIDVFSPFVNGEMPGSRFSLPETLRRSNLSVQKSQLGSRGVFVLEGVGEWGYHAIWLDPTRGYLPLRIVQRKQGQDKNYDGRPLASFGLKQTTNKFDATNFAVIGGQHIVTGFTLLREDFKNNDTKESMRFVVSFSDINLNPDFSKDPFVPGVAIPDGFPVTVREAPQINYEWRDGKIVKSVHQPSVENLEGNWFQRASPFRLGLMLLAGLAVIALGIFWYRHWVRTQGGSGHVHSKR